MNDTPDPHAFHAASAQDVLDRLATRETGLGAEEAARRLAEHGPNRLPEPPARSPLLRFLSHFHNVLIYVLIGSAAVTAALQHWVDTGVILAVVLVNAVIGYVQEGRAEQAMEAIRGMLAPRSAVLRDGARISVDAADLVPGDVVLVEAGDRVPADLRLIEARGLKAEEAILTGESVPVDKTIAPVSGDAVLGERGSMLFSGTLIAAGAGRGVVVATGAATEIGHISGMLSRVETLTTPLVAQMDRFARWLTVFILIVAASLLAYGYFVDHVAFADFFMAVVGLSVAAIPEGLPAVLTITLAVGVQAMARRNAIVRRLPAIETLGSVSVICSDKTGTLTRNEMMAATLVSDGHVYSVAGDGYAPEGAVRWREDEVAPQDHAVLADFARVAALCNDAALHGAADGWVVEGDPMEGALMALAGKLTGDGAAPFRDWTRVDAIPFDAAHRYMATLHRDGEGNARIDVKGAPEAVLALCAGQRSAEGGTEPLDPAHWQDKVEDLAGEGQRVIAVATRAVPRGQAGLDGADLEGQLTLIGLVGLIDPPRPEAVAAVAECHAAGIRVKMITGDHAATARAIAAMIGLQNHDRVLTGADLEAMDDAALADLVVETDIFARTSPAHKLRLVEDLAGEGQRVIAVATRAVPRGQAGLDGADLEGQLTLIGLVGLIDPPRPEAVAAVAECHAAGIRVKMITGDHAATARAIAAMIGLQNHDRVLTGADLEAMDDAALADLVVETDIFARTSPAHKLRLVAALQARGLTVAMTGDGVNDAPALKRADAGIAMGLKGSSAAKEAAELVLADDNFASIVAAVREGRTVYDNIKKVISWTLPTNAGEALTIIVALFAGMALPITAVQILWVNLITAVTLGLALAFEPSEPGTMARPPRPRSEPLLTGGLVWHIVLVSSLFLLAVFGMYFYAIDRDYPAALAQSIAMNTLVVLEIFHLFFIRNIHGASLTWAAAKGTRIVWACVIAVTAAQFAITYLPPLQAVFGTQAVPLFDGLIIVAVGAVFFALIEAEKQMRLAFRWASATPAG
ncbi:HAD-IC family P-type ATPase [Celeribacter indicus]|nr:HAD-IC family P-type ATPase [Celeribacter indicus]